MRNHTTNTINLNILFIFVIAPLVGFVSQKYLGKGFNTVVIPPLFVGAALLLIFRKYLSYSGPLIFLTGFLIYTMVSDAVLANKEYTMSYFIQNSIFGSVLAIFIIENTKYSDRYIKNAYILSAIILFIAFVVSLIQEFVDINFFLNPEDIKLMKFLPPWETRLSSIYSWIDTIAIGHCFFPVLAIVIGQQLKQKGKYIWIFYLIGAIVAFLSKSRFIMINLLILMILIPIYRKINFASFMKYLVIILIIVGGFVMVANQLKVPIGDIVEKRILESDKGGMVNGSAGTRLLAFEIFGKFFSENAVFGKGKLHDFVGKGKDFELVRALEGRSSQIHVGYLSLFYYYGLIGGLIFLGFLISMTSFLVKSAKIHHYWGPLFGFVQIILSNFTLVTLNVFFMGYILCFMFDRYYLQRQEILNIKNAA